MELDKGRIEDAIVRQVADDIMSEEELRSRVIKAVDDRINNLFKTVADAQISAQIETAIRAGFDHEYTRVNSFGQKSGSPTTIRAELERLIAGYWNERVNKQGKPDTGYGADYTRAEWVMMQIVADSFKGDMKQHIVNLGGSLKDGLRAELYKTVNGLLSEVFHVNSDHDQKISRDGNVGSAIIHPKPGPV